MDVTERHDVTKRHGIFITIWRTSAIKVSDCIIKKTFYVQKWKACKKNILSWIWGVDRKIRPSRSLSGITRPRDARQRSSGRIFFVYLSHQRYILILHNKEYHCTFPKVWDTLTPYQHVQIFEQVHFTTCTCAAFKCARYSWAGCPGSPTPPHHHHHKHTPQSCWCSSLGTRIQDKTFDFKNAAPLMCFDKKKKKKKKSCKMCGKQFRHIWAYFVSRVCPNTSGPGCSKRR